MRLVATQARLVSLGRGSVHLRVAALTLLLQGAGVGLVAALAISVALVDLSVLQLVTAPAFDLQRLGPMRQAAMAVGAGSVPFE